MTFQTLLSLLAWGDSDSDPSLFHHFIRPVFASEMISKTHKFQYIFNTNTIQNREFFENFQNIARVETDEAETWYTARFEHAESENIN